MRWLILFVFLSYASHTQAQMVFTTRAPESVNDKRQEYIYKLLDLSLQKTEAEFGSYILELAPSGATMKRSLVDVRRGKYKNFFVRNSVSTTSLAEMEAVPFPVDLGIVGYRVAFTSNKDLLKATKTLADLKKYKIVQGLGWLDTKILKSNGFNVETAGSYDGIFRVVASGRADLFMRGVNELLTEWLTYKHIPNLTYDEHVLLYYPLPRFFFTTKNNKEAAKRVYRGLVIAYEDGSLQELWKQYYGPSIDFVNLKSRRFFEIENPFLQGVDDSYKRYLYRP
ncbi:ABC transporter substrate-binding protein [Kiloniella majae]|uniref:ABC transporter substrate-binding protein n=1 Tax=Kiloniella majae TaxID=1938558 RepID=UPI000A278BB5|nr:ABC transporter substrate-binding protein [Kiloniella majae]